MKHWIAAVVLGLVAVVMAVPRTATADIKQRVVSGHVLNDADAPVKDAVVYLKDTKTLTVKSYITNADGAYRFGQLSGTTDYELWAEAAGKKSKSKAISSFDTKSQFTIDLKL